MVTPAGEQFPPQENFLMREYTLNELIDIVAKFQQKGREGIWASLGQLWDGRKHSIPHQQEMEKMSYITTRPASSSAYTALGGEGEFKVLTPVWIGLF